MSLAKRRMASGRFGLEANYISSENGTITPATAFTGQYVYCVQYNVVKCTVTSNVSGTITFDFSDDGVNSRATVVDTVTGGTAYFRVVNVESQYVRILWSAGVLPASLVIYTAFSKSSGGGYATSSSTSITAGNAGIGIGGTFPSWSISNLFTLTAGSGISITGTYPTLTVASTPTTNGKTMFVNSLFNMGKTLTRTYIGLGSNGVTTTTLGNAQCIMPLGGTFSNLYIQLSAAVNTGNTRNYALNVNGVDVVTLLNIVNPATTGNSGAITYTVNQGDLVCLSYQDSNTGGGGGLQGLCSIAFG